jgi:two-component system phosphate regulon response regulator OmpR
MRIQAILRRARPPSEPAPLLRFGGFEFDPARLELRDVNGPVRLTAVETRLLTLLAERAGTPVSREELGQYAEGTLNLRSVDVQVTRLRRKIEPDPRVPRYLQTVRGKGYLLQPD